MDLLCLLGWLVVVGIMVCGIRAWWFRRRDKRVATVWQREVDEKLWNPGPTYGKKK